MSTLPAPVAVWDPNDARGVFRHHLDEASQWAQDHFPDRARNVVFAAFYLIDAPFAVVHMVKRNEDGRIYTDPETGDLAMEPPATVMLDGLPPERLWR